MDRAGWRSDARAPALSSWDVIVVGLGTAGAAAVAACSAEGLRVLGVDRDPLERAGASWLNGVPEWAFEAAGVAAPWGEELHARGLDFHMLAGWGPQRVVMRGHDLMEVDMGALGRRLRTLGQQRGARLRQLRVLDFDGRHLQTSEGQLTAEVYVDASGLSGASLMRQPGVPREDICVAAQHLHAVTDLPAARDFFERHEVRPGHTLCFTSIAGGYSILNLRLDGDRLAVLAGAIPGLGHPSGPALIQRFRREHPWVGAKLRGGSRPIPLQAPPLTVGEGRVALIGDAARQVHSAHGSGIAQQLLAAQLLARVVASGRGPAEYNRQWQRRFGGLLAGADVFRRFSAELGVEQLGVLMEAGVLTPGISADVLTQRRPRPAPRELLRAGRGLIRAGRVSARLAPVLARMAALEAHYLAYPGTTASLERWMRHRRVLLGPGALMPG